MIRINLLDVVPRSSERLGSIFAGGPSSTFISRREALAGALFLALTVVILGALALRFAPGAEEPAEAVTAPRTPPEPSAPLDPPQPLAAQPEPAQEPPAAPAIAEPTRPVAPSRPAPPQPHAGPAVTAVRATPLDGRLDVFLEMANAPAVKGFRVDNPPRFVFDIEGAALAVPGGQRTQTVSSPLVKRLRIAQFTLEPPVVRLVLEAGEAPLEAAVSTFDAGVSIRVTQKP